MDGVLRQITQVRIPNVYFETELILDNSSLASLFPKSTNALIEETRTAEEYANATSRPVCDVIHDQNATRAAMILFLGRSSSYVLPSTTISEARSKYPDPCLMSLWRNFSIEPESDIIWTLIQAAREPWGDPPFWHQRDDHVHHVISAESRRKWLQLLLLFATR